MPSFIKIFFWNAVLVLVGVLIIEAIYGSWFSSNQLNELNILRNRVWHYDFEYPGIGDHERNITYTRDRWGLRGAYGTPADIDILTVGGSTTDQRYITDGKTWQAVLQQRFRAAGSEVQVANAGVDGRTSFGHQNDFALWFPKISALRPHYVLLYVGLNDMYFTAPHERYDQAQGRKPGWRQLLKGNSAIYKLLQSILGTYRVERRNMGHGAIDYANAEWVDTPLQPPGINAKLSQRVAFYAQRYQSLIDSVRAMGATPIIVTQPRGDSRPQGGTVIGLKNPLPAGQTIDDPLLGPLHNETANGVDYYTILQLFNEVALQLCQQNNGICLDLAHELQFADGDFYDYAHNTQQGAEKIAEYLYVNLQPEILGQ